MANHAAHHLIPVSIARDLVVTKAAAESGYNINRTENGVMLPTDPQTAINVQLPMHSGGHLGSYFDVARNLLVAREQAARSANNSGNPWNEMQLLTNISAVESRLRSRLLDLSDPLKLQNDDPLKP